MVVATGKSILNRIGIGKIKIYKAPTYNINEGIVGPNKGPKGRDVLIQDMESLERLLESLNCQ